MTSPSLLDHKPRTIAEAESAMEKAREHPKMAAFLDRQRTSPKLASNLLKIAILNAGSKGALS